MGSGTRIERYGGVAVIVLDRPSVMNRFEGTMREDLLATLQALAEDGEVRALMITGAGDHFSAGADIEELVSLHERGDSDEIRRRVDLGAAVVRQLRTMPKPVIAAVDGNAAGAGMNLALACDVRLGTERTVFTESFVHIGLVPDWGGLHSLVQLVGLGRAADLVMTGERLRADRAEAIGILQRIYPVETFAADALAFTARLAEGPARALAAMKQGLRAAAEGDLEAVFLLEHRAQPALFAGADCLAGLHAFLQKAVPAFLGDS